MLPRALNLDRIFSEGHDGIALPRSHYQQLHSLIQALEWVVDPEGIYTRIPTFLSDLYRVDSQDKFLKEALINGESMKKCPENLLNTVISLLDDPHIMGNWLIAHKPILRFVSVWDGAEDLPWHWDGPAGADFFFLIYLNMHSGWVAADGGQLQVGKRTLEGNYLKVDSSCVEDLASYDPSSRTLVCCNNQNPQFVHQVKPLSTTKERTVLMVGFDMIRASSCNQKP